MIKRILQQKVVRDLEWSPVVGIIGPRQVGKTTLVKSLEINNLKPFLYLDLELQEDLYKLRDAQSYLEQHQEKCIIIDEIQIKPELFALLRALTDKKREPARFIVLGSASPSIIKQKTETLAGRISYHELTPFSLGEVKDVVKQEEHWLKGGFPNALLASNMMFTRKWLNDFIETFIFRDIVNLGFQIPSNVLKNMLSMIAHFHGNLMNTSSLSNSLGISHPTTQKYIDLLEGSFLIRRLMPYHINIGKRLTKSPKIYFRDSGLLHSLMRIADLDSLYGNPVVGASWEGYVIEQIIREAPEFSEFYFYRTSNGAELDLFMISPSGRKIGFEIKFSITPIISKGFYISCEDLNIEKAYVITPRGERYVRNDNLVICPLETFLEKELPLLEN